MRIAAAFDVGGTTVKVALVDECGSPTAVSRVPTPTSDADGIALVRVIQDSVAALRGEYDVVAIGVALPGIVDLAAERAVFSANLGWHDVPFGAMLRERFDLPIAITHDIRAGALAEARFGALQGSQARALFAAVGTGVSVAVVDRGAVAVGDPWQGEIGQLLVRDPFYSGDHRDAPLRPLESFASARGIARQAGAPDSEEALNRANNGDSRAVRAWSYGVAALGEALAAAVVSFGATQLVIGGGLAEARNDLFVPLTAAVNRQLPSSRAVTVTPARLGDLAGCIGTAAAALDLAEPSVRTGR